MLSETFWIFICTTGATLLFGVARLCFKSKCSEIDFCCLKVVRDTTQEMSGDEERGTQIVTQQSQENKT